MGGNNISHQLIEALEAEQSMKARGFTASCGPTGGVVIDRWHHVRGVWHVLEGNFFWTAAGYNEPGYRTDTLQGAIDYTLSFISRA